MAEFLDQIEAFKMLCKSSKKWGLFINICWPENNEIIDDIIKAAPYLNFERDTQMITDGTGIILGTENEIQELYWQTVGDDGPTDKNPYDGPVKISALTCDSEGNLHNENT